MDVRSAAARQRALEALDDDRISDDDRKRAANDIAAAAGAGLVDLGDADGLLARVWSARTRSELVAALDRLPGQWLARRRRAEDAAWERDRTRQALHGLALRWLGLVALLVAVWALTTPGGYFWPVWPALGTGSCLLGQVAAARGVAGPGRGAGPAATGCGRAAATSS